MIRGTIRYKQLEGPKMEWTPAIVRARFIIALLFALVLFFNLTGCAMLPQAMQPTEESSAYAEGTWLVLDAIDTAQTVQIAKHPQCYHEADPIAAKLYGGEHPGVARVVGTNVALAIVHTMITSWLDTEVAKAQAEDPDDVGPWYVGRVAWHAVSILGTGGAVVSNYGIGLKPTSTECNR